MSQTPEEKDLLTAEESAQESPALPEEESTPKKTVAYDESLFEGSTVFSKPKEEPKKKQMRPAVKGAVIAGIAVAVAAAVGLTVLLLPGSDGGSNVPSNMLSAVYGVTEVEEADLAEARLYNAAGVLRFYPETAEATSSDGEASVSWLVEGYEKYNLSGAGMLVGGAVKITTENRIDPKEGQPLADDYVDRLDTLRYGAEAGEGDESIYGFDRPFAAFCMTDKAGAKTAVILGDWSPDGTGRYVTATGKDGVYIINDSGYSIGRYSFAATPADLIGATVVEPVTQNENNADYFIDAGLSLMDDITLSGRNIGTTLVIENAPDDLAALTYVLTKPSFRATNEDNVDKLFNVASNGFTCTGAYVLGYTDADLAEYGLDKPYVDLIVRVGDWRTHLSFGKERDGYYPFLCEGSDVIYSVSVEGCDWVALKAGDYYFDSLFLEYVSNVAQITVETEEKAVTFRLERESPDAGNDFDVVAEGYEDVAIDTQEFCFYYGRILALTEEEPAPGSSPTDSPFLTFRIRYLKESKKEDVITLYRYSTRRYLFKLNGEGNSLVAASNVQDLYDCLDTLLEGEEIGRAKYN